MRTSSETARDAYAGRVRSKLRQEGEAIVNSLGRLGIRAVYVAGEGVVIQYDEFLSAVTNLKKLQSDGAQ